MQKGDTAVRLIAPLRVITVRPCGVAPRATRDPEREGSFHIMTIIEQPSMRTDREACALHASTSANRSDQHRRPGRLHHLIRLFVVAVALMGTVGLATPATTPQEAEAATGTGQMIVDFAMGYLGAPYVWAGEGPWGFDCSGFTQFVIANTLGIDIGHSTAGQTAHGWWVDWGAWQPGDLVFFANTWGPGISHVGIYIGDGQFIHAENEATGVTISSLYSDYYSGHYYGAYRIG